VAANVSERTFRKHTVAYVGLVFWTPFILAIPLAVAVTQSGTLRLIFAGLCLLILVGRTYRFFYFRTIRWVVTDDGLRVSQGILPWRKWSFHHPYDTIFEAYYNHSFLGHWLNYATCSIRRTEGMTTAMSERRIRDAKTLTGLINSKLAEIRAAAKPVAPAPVAAAASAPGTVERLSELARLKAAGDITADEYEVMKARTIGESPPGDASPSLAT
jgi:hypothetical protein